MGISATLGAAAISAGATAYSANKNAKAAKKGQTSTSEPWSQQQPYLLDTFENAQSIYNNQAGSPYYQGPLHAPLNGFQLGAIEGITGHVNLGGGQLVDASRNAALTGMDNAGQYGNNANRIATGNLGPLGGANTALNGTLNNYATTALGQVPGYTQNLNGVLARTQADPTQSNIAAATQYANNAGLDGQITAALRDVKTGLQSDLLGLNQSASAGGNLNSSRAGAAEAVTKARAEDRAADIAAQMRGNAYNTGLGLAENARVSNLTGSLSALNQMGSFIGQGANAAGNQLSLGESARLNDLQTRLGANQQLGNSVSLGLQGAQLSNNMALGNWNALLNAGGVVQNDLQNAYNADFQRWQGEDQRATDLLNRYTAIVGGQQWGGTTNTRAPAQTPNYAQSLLGGAATGLGMWNQYQQAFPQTFNPGSFSTVGPSYTGGGTIGTNAVGGTGMLGGGV
ncbi:hypothetical protein GAY31_11440 [Azospirillum brasilense]|nr:hypothetical protein [Azospirillum brasilense]